MIVANQPLNKKQSFGMRIPKDGYDDYRVIANYNGRGPDKFILERLKGISHGLVCDFGAGQGRNTIPVAQLGHDVVAIEINDEGKKCIKQAAKKANVANRVMVLDVNLLDDFFLGKNKADFIFMSHISQHFNIDELKKVMANAVVNLKKGGEFVFDALIKKDVSKIPLQEKSNVKEFFGTANFAQNNILEAAQKVGLSFSDEVLFAEKDAGRADYETQKDWIKDNQLKWFVFKK